jgi:hypothetical protein
MNQEERKKQEQYLEIYYQSLHMTVLYENEFLGKLRGSRKALEAYRDEILDRINDKRRLLGRII